MATTVKIINELYDETIKKVSQNEKSWQEFLKTASMNYTNSFSEQLLIYAQRPDTVASADIVTWNETYKRLVNRGCPGIGLLYELNGQLRIKYVWGLNDTHSIYGRKGKQLKIWKVPKIYENRVVELLENRFGQLDEKDSFVNAMKSLANNLMEDNYIDYYNDFINNKNNTRLANISSDDLERHYKTILQNSIAYMIINRSGIDPTPYFNSTDFENISIFQDMDNIARLGATISDIAKIGIKEIYVSLKNVRMEEINKIYTFDKQNNLLYDDKQEKEVERRDLDEHNLQKSRRLHSSEFSSNGRNTNGDRQI